MQLLYKRSQDLRLCRFIVFIRIVNFKAFAECFQKNTTIQALELVEVDASEGKILDTCSGSNRYLGFTELGDAIEKNVGNALQIINLSCNQMKDKGAIGLSTGIASLNHGYGSINHE